jgi:hypothetical protein
MVHLKRHFHSIFMYIQRSHSMKKSLLLLTTIVSFSLPAVSAALPDAVDTGNGVGVPGSIVSTAPFGEASDASRAVASAEDLVKIKAHIRGYGSTLGLPDKIEAVGNVGCCALFSTTFKVTERFLLNELAGQVLTHFLAMAMDDFADGKMDGIADGKKISYAKEVAKLLGVQVSEDELKSAPIDNTLVVRLIGFSADVVSRLVETGGQKDQLIAAASAFAKEKMDKARKSLAVALIQETDRIISLELGNGKIDGLDANGIAIDWKKEMQDSVARSLSRVLDGVL